MPDVPDGPDFMTGHASIGLSDAMLRNLRLLLAAADRHERGEALPWKAAWKDLHAGQGDALVQRRLAERRLIASSHSRRSYEYRILAAGRNVLAVLDHTARLEASDA